MADSRSPWVLPCLLAVLALALSGCTAREQPGGVGEGVPVPLTPAGESLRPVDNLANGTASGERGGEARAAYPLVPGKTYRRGDIIVVSGETILSPGTRLLVEVTPVPFHPTRKGGPGLPASGISGTVPVAWEKGAARGSFSFAFDTTGWDEGEYLVRVRAVGIKNVAPDAVFSLS
ncbi:MAG: hypothetical protein QFX32_04490 [Methanolinea sp.]|nr:hypothetical protein [Methanolinea sp.]